MATIQRTRVIWEGFTGAPGYTNFFASVDSLESHNPNSHRQDIQEFFEAVGTFIPLEVTMSFDPEVIYFDDVSGDLLQYGNLATPLTIELGSAAVRGGAYAAATGASIEWRTAGVRNNRRVSGRTFLVPLLTKSYEDNGTLSPGALAAIRDAADAYVNDGLSEPVVWARPVPEREEDDEVIPGRPGASFPITSAVLRDKVSTLRTRRD